MQTPKINAPEFPEDTQWLGSPTSYQLKDFRGKIVLLDFWTYGCINCYHILPDLKKLENRYEDNLIVIGVHSAKFDNEKETKNIQKAIEKYHITHPVLNDADAKIWDAYAVKAWPTLVLIDPNGKIVLQQSGENFYEAFQKEIENLQLLHKKQLKNTKYAFQSQKETQKSTLFFPSKFTTDPEGNFWIANTGKHQIVQISQKGEILQTIGSGVQGLQNGSFEEAQFDEPQGIALKDEILYIADTRNHLLRKIDLKNKIVSTIAGDGKKSYVKDFTKPVKSLNSPWDLEINGNILWIANAGSHQILSMNTQNNEVTWKAGSGAEALFDGKNLQEAAFAQSSGLFFEKQQLYIADPEASAIRVLDTQTNTVLTLIGKGLFYFGDKDGNADIAKLQHCMAVGKKENFLYIADTYNNKIKVWNIQKNMLTTLISNLDEPNDLIIIGDTLWILNTNKHQIISYHLQTKKINILLIK